MRTLEGLSPDWIQIGEAIQNSTKSIREIARERNLSDTAVRKMMKKHGWARPDQKAPRREPIREPRREPVVTAVLPDRDDLAKYLETASVKELTGLGRNIINDLMLELAFLNRNHETLRGMVEDYVNGSDREDRAERAKLAKALDHETRCKNANALASALAKLNDAGPGKKEERQDNAEQAASSGRFAAPSAPKFTH